MENNPLLERYGGLLPIEKFYAYLKFNKKGSVQKLMQKLKYQNYPELGTMLGNWYGADLKILPAVKELDLILPVPLHRSKLKKRGYNQSDYFAKGLSAATGVPWDPKVLRRIKKSESQTRKDRKERFENVMGIFNVDDREAIEGKNVLLVDDVITTGATFYACATALQDAGVSSISLCALAVAQK